MSAGTVTIRQLAAVLQTAPEDLILRLYTQQGWQLSGVDTPLTAQEAKQIADLLKQTEDTATSASATTLEDALQQCQRVARDGYRLAAVSVDETERVLADITAQLRTAIDNLSRGKAKAGVEGALVEQLRKFTGDLQTIPVETRSLLKARQQELDDFTVVLFGRTMAGKSTLMEILTGGDGSSIGKGAQRTTRDTREYHWRGLKVVDVPGIAAFEGKQDEDVAITAARKADLVLFLLTDDAPQASEAAWYAKLRELGKPILTILNVKQSIRDEDDRAITRARLDDPELHEIMQQFHQMADRHISGARGPYIFTHLNARYLGGVNADSELMELSQFHEVEQRLIEEVISNGRFLRVKSFVDGALKPLIDTSETLLTHSAENATSADVLAAKHKKLHGWAQRFLVSGRARIQAFAHELRDQLLDEIPGFAEQHVERADAGEKWKEHVRRLRIETRAEQLLEDLAKECHTELDEISREVGRELKLVQGFSAEANISMSTIFDSKTLFQWTLNIGAFIALFVPGLGPAAAAAVGLIKEVAGWLFFDSREKKLNRQRKKLQKRLRRDVERLATTVAKELKKTFDQELVRKQSDVILNALVTATNAVGLLADTQRSLAWRLVKQQTDLHQRLVNEALDQVGRPEIKSRIRRVARIPGKGVKLILRSDDSALTRQLRRLLGEETWITTTTDSVALIAEATGVAIHEIQFDEARSVARIPRTRLENTTHVQLAQQLAMLHVRQG